MNCNQYKNLRKNSENLQNYKNLIKIMQNHSLKRFCSRSCNKEVGTQNTCARENSSSGFVSDGPTNSIFFRRRPLKQNLVIH